jgi:uncharacterized metal-binding protein YceD (DUF177 family)
MNPFKAYQIPFLGLKTGFHDFEFELDNAFFAAFEHSEIQSGDLKANLTLEKQSTMLVLDFQVEGVVEGVCDRCGDSVEVEVEHTDRLIVKYGDATEITDDDILVVGPSEHILELHHYLYEYAHLGLPARVVHDDESECNQKALEILRDLKIDDRDEDDDVDPRWEALKKLK